jgi:hypothetical protein
MLKNIISSYHYLFLYNLVSATLRYAIWQVIRRDFFRKSICGEWNEEDTLFMQFLPKIEKLKANNHGMFCRLLMDLWENSVGIQGRLEKISLKYYKILKY